MSHNPYRTKCKSCGISYIVTRDRVGRKWVVQSWTQMTRQSPHLVSKSVSRTPVGAWFAMRRYQRIFIKTEDGCNE